MASRRSFLWMCAAVALAAVTGGLIAATLGEVRLLARSVPPTPPEVTQDVVLRAVADQDGRRASFRILLFSDEFRWRLNSYDTLESGTALEFSPEMKAVLSDAVEVICIGASSEEVPAGLSPARGRVQEERRAARRAERVATWVRSALTTPIPVRKLNIGHHEPTGSPGDTSDQRRVVIILVLDREDGANLDQALRAAMARERKRSPIFDALLTRYSLGAGESFIWVP